MCPHKTYDDTDELQVSEHNAVIILECARLFHSDGARLILCGNNWERLETLAEQLTDESDPTTVSSQSQNIVCIFIRKTHPLECYE